MTAMERVQPETPASLAGPEWIRAGERSYAGVRTRVLEVGPRRLTRGAPRIVLLHGYCDSADTWRPVLEQLAEAGISAVAVDLPGFGEADPLRPGAMLPQLDQFVDAILEEQTKHGKVVLAGNSLGGTMGLRAAYGSRRRVAGVISIAAPGFVDSWLVRAVGTYPLRLWAALPLPVPKFVVRGVAEYVVPRLLYADHDVAADEHVRRFTSLFPDYRAATTRLDQARQLVEELAEAYDGLDQLATPLLVIACGKDRLVTAASGRRLHSLVPHSRLLVREDWGHCPQLDDPATLAELMAYFTAGATRKRRRRGVKSEPLAEAG
ncbi:alpha/beta fold hydrolase [Amycolatopsis alkalitolerans]|uniref:Alpha/beta hydrolase n=1 Tax=Amycolatopsis alkalitolerans TaxID=2547244 RepID=A0A5C4LXS6_9PSEU|nr:alpha/beta hydrolase [Amycolatopsis alkalitolerans]TNC24412.1 alpha/beta hydrolase [Amycolatopsis alkalitolerans]